MKRLGPSIFGRVVLSFLLLVALPTLGLLLVLSQTAVRSLYEASASQARETGDQILKAINQEADMVSYQAGALLNDPDLAANLATYTERGEGPGRTLAATQIDRNLIGFFNLTNKAGTIAVLTRGSGWYSYGNLSNPGTLAGTVLALVAEAEANPGRVVFQDSIADFAFTAAIAPGIGEQDLPIRALVLRMRAAVFFGLSFSGGIADRTDVVLLGRGGQVLFSTLPSATLQALIASPRPPGDGTQTLDGQVWLTSTQSVESTGWQLVTLRNEASLTARFRTYEQFILLGLAGLLALFGLYAWQVFARIASPIQHVVHSMDRVAEGDWGFRIPNPGLRDLDVLVDGFNRMSGEIVRLNRERLGVELEALRHQINPHFLANTLNVVKLMAASARMRSIETLTADLMVLLSDSYQGGTSLTEVSAEVRNIESYVRIMKVRFDTGFTLVTDVEPGAFEALTPRMLLQPLVENAILHGLTGLSRPGRIDLRVRIDRQNPWTGSPPVLEPGVAPVERHRLVFEVEDNGRGMVATEPAPSADRLGRIGLDNVTRRLELTFGPAVHLQVASEPDRFTRVTLVLPLLGRSTHA